MNKKQVQKRVLQNGKPLDLSKFSWDEKTRTFSSDEDFLVLDFRGVSSCTFNTGSDCTFKTGSYCTFNTGFDCTFNTGSYCNFNTCSYCNFKTGFYCNFKTGFYCNFKTGSDCTFNTGSDCTFNTGSDCIFKTDFDCTFNTGSDCTFKTGSYCVVIRRDIYKVIEIKEGVKTQLAPHGIKGYLENGLMNGEPHIIADGILSKIISKKGNIYKVINHGESKQSYLIEQDGTFSHGETLREAREGLIYKTSNRDKAEYENMTLETVLSKEDCIKAYMAITGACSSGVKYFVENQSKIKDKYFIAEIIELTRNQFGNNEFEKFFNNK